MTKSKKALLLTLVAFASIMGTGFAYADTNTPLNDSEFNLVIEASVLGAVVAPIVGWATQENTTTKTADPFNWRQYAISLIVGIPAILTLTLTETSTLHVTVIGYQGDVMLFVMAFLNGLAVDYSKSRIGQAIQNK